MKYACGCFYHVSYYTNIIGVSCNLHDMLRDVRAMYVLEALEMVKLKVGVD
jgi:hypothetical protein